MAFPSIAGTPVSQGGTTSASPGVAITMPSGIVAGELLITIVAGDTPTTFTASGWTSISAGQDSDAQCQLTIFAKIAAGSDSMTLVGEANDYATITFRVQNHGCATVSDILLGTLSTHPTTVPNTAPDPPASATPPRTGDYLFIECFAADDDDDTASYVSTNYTAIAQQQSANSTSSCLVAAGYRQLNTGSAENPGTMAMAAAEEWVAQTILIRPKLLLDAVTGAYSVSGQSADFKRGYALPCVTGSYAVTGSAATLSTTVLHKGELYLGNSGDSVTKVAETTSRGGSRPGYDEWGIYHEVISESPTVVPSVSEYIRVGFGASGTGGDKYYSLVGMVLEAPNAPWSLENKLSAVTGSYSVTGSAANFKRSLVLPCTTGSYSVSGQTAALQRGYQLDLDSGSFTVTGSPVDFKRSEVLDAEVGSYAVTGQPALFKRALKMEAATGSYSVSGQPTTLIKGVKLELATGSYSVTGQPALFKRALNLPLNTGSYSVSGQSAAFQRALQLAAVPGSYAVTGYAATLTADSGRYVSCTTTDLTLTPYTAAVELARPVSCDAVALTMTPADASVGLGRSLECTVDTLTLSTALAQVGLGRSVECTTPSLTLSPIDCTVTWVSNWDVYCETAIVTLTPVNASVALGRDVACATTTLTLTTADANVGLGDIPLDVLCTTATLTLTAYQSKVWAGIGRLAWLLGNASTAPVATNVTRSVIGRPIGRFESSTDLQ